MRFLRIFFNRAFYYGKITFFVILIISLLWLFLTDHGKVANKKMLSSIYQWTSESGLKLENIYINGVNNVSEDEILQKTNLRKNTPILAINLQYSVASLLEIGWIENVSIKRKIPNTIYIDVQEKQPIAIWQNHGRLTLIDKNGQIIGDEHIKKYENVPLIIGEDARLLASDLLNSLSENANLKNQISAIVRVGERRWDVIFKNGIKVKLPEKQHATAFKQIVELYENDTLFKSNIEVIDLRIKDKIFIETKNNGKKL